MAYENFIKEVEDRIAIITINRPPANTLSTGAVKELNQVLDELEKESSVRVLVLTGKDREDKPEKSIFSAGADISEFGSFFGTDKAKEVMAIGQRTFTRIEGYPKPVIACLNGHALGGGLELAITCHLRVMAETAKLGVPEVTLGILPGYGGTTRLPRILPRCRALELLLSGVRISAEEALKLNLVNKVVPKGEELKEAKVWAKRLATGSAPLAMKTILEVVEKGTRSSLEETLELEREGITKLSGTKDAMEGITAFMQKRPPDFKGE